MYLRSNPETMLGQPAPQVFICTVDAIVLDDFLVGDYRLRPSHYEKLLAIGEFARVMLNSGRPVSVSLEGFTDSSGKEIMNRGLSANRAAETQNFLVRLGVVVRNVVGSGESNPRATNATEAGRRKNRRVEIRLCVPQPPKPQVAANQLKVSNLMRQAGVPPTALLAGAQPGYGLGDPPPRGPWRNRAGLRQSTQGLSFLTLDRFDWNQASLTPRLREMVRLLAEHVKLSWNSTQPITTVRLVGHTDSTGDEKYNRGLGDRRAQAVRNELLGRLTGLTNKVLVVVEPSPGELKPIADNRTGNGRARNRRVEVFITIDPIQPPQPPPPPQPPTNWWNEGEKATRKIEEEAERRRQQQRYNQPIPPPPRGKSLSQWLDETLAPLPRFLARKIRDIVINGSCYGLEVLLTQVGARLGDKQKEELRKQCQEAAKKPIR